MTSTPILSTMWCIPVAQNSVFRMEVSVAGKVITPLRRYNLEYIRSGEKWVVGVLHSYSSGFAIALQAPRAVKTFTYKPYVRTSDNDIQYGSPNSYIRKGIAHDTCILGVEVTLPQPVSATYKRPISAISNATIGSPWNFTSSDDMENWDVILCVGDSKFYVHKQILSFASSTFRAMFNGEFREKNQQEVPVNVEGTNASHLEAFLQSIYPCGTGPNGEFILQLIALADFYNVKPLLEKCVNMLKFLPNVSNVDKLRIAIKANSTSLEDAVIASLSKDDIPKLIAASFMDTSEDRWQKVVAKCRSMMP